MPRLQIPPPQILHPARRSHTEEKRRTGAWRNVYLRGAAALLLAVTLTACGDTGSTKPNTNKDPDTTPNGNTSTQPDTNGTEDDVIPGNSMNGGHNTDGGAVPGDGPESARGARTVTRARVRSEAAAFDSDYQQMLRNGRGDGHGRLFG